MLKINFTYEKECKNLLLICSKEKKLPKIENLPGLNDYLEKLMTDPNFQDPVSINASWEYEGLFYRILVVKCEKTLKKPALNLGGIIAQKLSCFRMENVNIFLHDDWFADTLIKDFLLGLQLKSYRFKKYITKKDEKGTPHIVNIVRNDKKLEDTYEQVLNLIKSINFTKELVSEPANVLYPEEYAERCNNILTPLGVKVEILGVKEMKKLGMGALLGVGQGSIRESKMVVMTYFNAKDKKQKPIALVGKGVTFDTGGISLKPADKMEDMIYDMAGSAAVVGSMHLIAMNKMPVNVVGLIGLVENMPDGNAQRPGDIVTSMSSKTIQVLNTDAEGRLVLADVMTYCQENFKPEIMIDFATLTGAIVIALGNSYAGLFSNDELLAQDLLAASKTSHNNLWHMPIHEDYSEVMKSKVADLQNISNTRGAGSCTAAAFLQEFVEKDVKWAHIDIAGMAWSHKETEVSAVGASGFGVSLIHDFLQNYIK